MAIVVKQQNRAEEAIEAIKSLPSRCSDQAQESLDNILIDLYKVRASGRPDLAAEAQAAAHPPGPRLQRQAHQDGTLPGPQVPGHPRARGHKAPH